MKIKVVKNKMGNTQYGFGSPGLMTGSVLCLQKIFPLTPSKYQISKIQILKTHKNTATNLPSHPLQISNYQSYKHEKHKNTATNLLSHPLKLSVTDVKKKNTAENSPLTPSPSSSSLSSLWISAARRSSERTVSSSVFTNQRAFLQHICNFI